ncbi:biotin--[acetyl-CoA-carboxylase] ligase [Thioalkalivibrio nitratireducens DSM 14787]|uniref:Biotin--[acetyl-CoA-carboxylase] ligase n=1 Tax=Thioalkalivibrio nitratireducens (strain DSM 14787 / UNIQEM 213 / ALEN2) TaxID=1255043 RepID=L0DXF6_THIND|nr:biotin--[acetyl-CoA-carboxylase] ligase [Thioalkalivibrio nitratireducens]AGA33728.1 biotin--[acetyl-CoA-carboxylase] ligase [Thioalkalivibrio nitratireducens DSM 14787]
MWAGAFAGLAVRLEQACPRRWAGVELLPTVDSTNRRLLDSPALVSDRFHVCVAQQQTAGCGRRGRAWISAGGASLTFSVARALRPGERSTAALALAAGVGLTRGLAACGVSGFEMKWPNDLVTPTGAKLAGILVEARGRAAERVPAIVVGIGLNLTGAEALGVERPVADLSQIAGPAAVRMSGLLESILCAVVDAWDGFSESGLAPFVQEYARMDHLAGRRVRVVDSGEEGIVAGIDVRDGALLLERAGRRTRLYSGDVSIRVAPDG